MTAFYQPASVTVVTYALRFPRRHKKSRPVTSYLLFSPLFPSILPPPTWMHYKPSGALSHPLRRIISATSRYDNPTPSLDPSSIVSIQHIVYHIITPSVTVVIRARFTSLPTLRSTSRIAFFLFFFNIQSNLKPRNSIADRSLETPSVTLMSQRPSSNPSTSSSARNSNSSPANSIYSMNDSELDACQRRPVNPYVVRTDSSGNPPLGRPRTTGQRVSSYGSLGCSHPNSLSDSPAHASLVEGVLPPYAKPPLRKTVPKDTACGASSLSSQRVSPRSTDRAALPRSPSMILPSKPTLPRSPRSPQTSTTLPEAQKHEEILRNRGASSRDSLTPTKAAGMDTPTGRSHLPLAPLDTLSERDESFDPSALTSPGTDSNTFKLEDM